MGESLSALFNNVFGKKDMRILMVGEDAAGKTTILYKMKLGEIVTTIPTIGFNVESVEYKNIILTVWDADLCGGQYRQGAIVEAREELHQLVAEDELRNAMLLVFANKQDLPDAMTTMEITEVLDLHNLHKWFVQSTCAPRGHGLFEGLQWLSTELQKM